MYPYLNADSHNHQTAHLSSAEIQNPYEVLEDFFDFATVNEARAVLGEWLLASFEASDGEEQNYIHLFKNLVRLVEAAWLLRAGIK